MKVVRKAVIEGKEIQLVLLDDKKTIHLLCENEIISVLSGETWNNIKDEEWAQDGLMKIEAERYIRKQNAMKRLRDIAQEVF